MWRSLDYLHRRKYSRDVARRPKRPVSEVLRDAVRDSAKSRYRIAHETGISESTLSRFLNGADLQTVNVDLLAEYFDLELRPTGNKR